jgi:DNA-directed RNA polymerase, mitochondrial
MAVAQAAANGMMGEVQPAISLSSRLGAAAEDAFLAAEWKKLSPAQAQGVQSRLGWATNERSRRAAHKSFAHWAEPLLKHFWNEKCSKSIGAAFVSYLVRLGMFEHCKIPSRQPKKGKTNGIRLTDKARSWITDAVEFAAAETIIQWPLVIPPKPWTAPIGGGYHDRGELDHSAVPRSQRPLCLVRRAAPAHKKLLESADLSTVYAGLNAAQATAWRINPKVYEVVVTLMNEGAGAGGLTAADSKPIPERPTEADTDNAALAEWKRKAREAHAENRKLVPKRKVEYRTFTTARKFVGYPAIYFVYNLDFRGRVYACSDYLSPQGDDFQRGLLEFSKGDPLTEAAGWWLKIHLANTFGMDKESFEDRIAWANDNAQRFSQIAKEPVARSREWEAADQPWQFLAACFAWDEYVEYGIGSLCRLPVMLDGSCSGIQHYAALVCDSETGAAVNLVPRPPSEKPRDIYADVAARVMELLADNPDYYAQQWHACQRCHRQVVIEFSPALRDQVVAGRRFRCKERYYDGTDCRDIGLPTIEHQRSWVRRQAAHACRLAAATRKHAL